MGKHNRSPAIEVVPRLDLHVRTICQRRYPGHPKGCPNWGKRHTCPPQAPLLGDLLDLDRPVYCLHNCFDLASHVARMRKRHPDWSERRLRCCLYWQGTARKQLRVKVDAFLEKHPGHLTVFVPEACGVDVTATMRSIGIELEWPPVSTVYQVALVGNPKKGSA